MKQRKITTLTDEGIRRREKWEPSTDHRQTTMASNTAVFSLFRCLQSREGVSGYTYIKRASVRKDYTKRKEKTGDGESKRKYEGQNGRKTGWVSGRHYAVSTGGMHHDDDAHTQE